MSINLITAASLPASPELLFDMYLDPLAHAAFTGAPVTSRHVPAPRSVPSRAACRAPILHVEPKRLIVQTWRSIHFCRDEIDSVLILTFLPENGGGSHRAGAYQRRRR